MKLSKKKIFLPFMSLAGVLVACFLAVVCWILVVFHQCIPLLPYVPKILGFEKSQTYLILFQNNMELRPGGGFIGSYAIVQVDHGKFENFSVHNTYDTDGQLKRHIEPYYIVHRYLQNNLFMRDSNFDVDFEKSTQKVASMYTLETGKKVDGVVGFDLSYIQSLIGLVSPLYVWQYNETITPENLFLTTEKYVDKNSFAGSTQKQDFLRSLAENMLAKIHAHKIVFIFRAIDASVTAISQKHLLFFSQDPEIQAILGKNKFSSTLIDERGNTNNTINDFLGINEANIGVNKANYFLKRRIGHQVVLQKSGTIQENLKITYTNTSPNASWPTGKYIAYVRIILPKNTKLESISIDDKKQKIIPAITDYHIYGKPGFTSPDGLEVDKTEEEGKTLYGFIIIVDVHASLTVDAMYQLATPLFGDNPIYDLVYFKQPGTDADPLNLLLHYPSTYKVVSPTIPRNNNALETYIFDTSLATDQHVTIQLRKVKQH